jgi:UDP-galactopyranose mutase
MAAASLVGESVGQPTKYYHQNLTAGLTLLDTMRDLGVSQIVFSSTAAVYGEPDKQPIEESDPTAPTSPYGETKLAFERAMKWYEQAYGLRFASLRYFNAAGATELCGEDHEPETHLIPIVLQAAAGVRNEVEVFGDDYPTRDGSCVRDYIHVADLARAHVLALGILDERSAIYNLGCGGKGYTVLEVIKATSEVTGQKISLRLSERRAGDPAWLIASSEKIRRELGWQPGGYEHRVRASVDGQLLPIPVNLDTVNQLYGLNLTSFQLEDFFASVAEQREQIRTSEDVIVSRVGRDLYEKFFRNYTRKQWGLDPSELDAQVTARVPVRTNRDDRYFTDTCQVMPQHGYTRMFENMLDHANIKIMLNTDYREIERVIPFREMIYTGPIDEFFDLRFGRLPYRSLEFRHETHDRQVYQPAPVVNYPNEHPWTRITEFKYLTGQEHAKTSVVDEFPRAEGDPYYPAPRPENTGLYKKYQALASATPGVHFAGRLATYKYYNQDQVVAQALTLYKKLTGEKS